MLIRRLVPVMAIAAVLATSLVSAWPAAAAGAGERSTGTFLRVTVQRAEGITDSWTLRCNPAGGTHPNAVRACAMLHALGRPFSPLPTGIACTMIYGGPERARVIGRWEGTAVDASFARTNGCENARWREYEALLTAPGPVLVRGRVDLGPTCPVERPDEPCTIVGAPAVVTATSGARQRTAAAGADGFVLRLPLGVWTVTADAGMTCQPVQVDTRSGLRPSTVVIRCDTGIRSAPDRIADQRRSG